MVEKSSLCIFVNFFVENIFLITTKAYKVLTKSHEDKNGKCMDHY